MIQLKVHSNGEYAGQVLGSARINAYPQAGNLRYGGNTSCVEVRHENSLYVFDCGTGFRSLGQQLECEANGQPIRAHIFVSHFHWDHIQGIPFFRPLYENSAKPVCISLLETNPYPAARDGRTNGLALLLL